ncbi:hypothetical protein ACFWIA_25565 [Streptomyces sp. NPDC127068]|uniref:hypothetical protein n=1 Tax=Streptomyces sp. NPDC127068 TaxID=3347127 RepID=UPI00365EB6C0
MILKTTSRSTSRLRLAACVAAPVLALSVACGGGDDGGTKSHGIADAPDAPTADRPAEPSRAAQPSKSAGKETRPAGKSAFYDAQVTFVQCMRAKGDYPEYPDPKLSGYLDWDKINELGSQPGRNQGIKAGKNNVCVPELQAVMAVEPERDQQKSFESMLAHAKCMRDNGVSRFTNPTMSGGNAIPGGDPNPASPVLDHESPAYKKAERTCKPKLIDSVAGMQ